jgi:hypothetical protein
MGSRARAHLVYAIHHHRPWLFPAASGLDFRAAMADGCGGCADDGSSVAGADGARRLAALGTRRGRIDATHGRRIDSADRTAPCRFSLANRVGRVGGGLCGSIFVVCPPIISSFTPVTQRAAVIAIFVAIYTSAGIFAPIVTGSVIESAATVLQGYYTGYTITGFVQLLGGLAGLLLLWPTTQDTKEAIGLIEARKASR